MNEPKESGQFYDKDEVGKLEKAQANIRANATPEQLSIMHEADVAFMACGGELDARIQHEHVLRNWAKKFCDFPLDVSEMEEFSTLTKKVKPGTFFVFKAKRGTAHLYKTAFGHVDLVGRYVQVLERTVIDITNNSQFTPLSPPDLIKLAIARLIKGAREWVANVRIETLTLNRRIRKKLFRTT